MKPTSVGRVIPLEHLLTVYEKKKKERKINPQSVLGNFNSAYSMLGYNLVRLLNFRVKKLFIRHLEKRNKIQTRKKIR